jgi:hypothetical protein
MFPVEEDGYVERVTEGDRKGGWRLGTLERKKARRQR